MTFKNETTLPADELGEAVAWQWRYKYDDGKWGGWQNERRADADALLRENVLIAEESRPLYAHPSPSLPLKEEGWRPLETAPDHKLGPFLVCNNPKALNAFGRPSHVWCVGSIHSDDNGGFCAYDGFQKIRDLKLYMPVPFPIEGNGNG